MIEIKTERLVVKKIKNSDKERLVTLLGDFNVSKTLGTVAYPYTIIDAEKWLETTKNQEFNLNIFLNDSLIGGVGLRLDEDEFYELGYWLGADYWGQGYGTEAVKGLLDCAISKLQSPKIKANVDKENTTSAKVLEKMGFRPVGEGEVFSLSRQKTIPCLKLVLE
jgi:ribosomal-protein-alanine N-acetyltransferase